MVTKAALVGDDVRADIDGYRDATDFDPELAALVRAFPEGDVYCDKCGRRVTAEDARWTEFAGLVCWDFISCTEWEYRRGRA